MKYTVVCFSTPGIYERVAIARLVPSLDALKIPYKYYRVKEKGAWTLNCAQKPTVIHRALKELSTNIVYIDVDAVVKSLPVIFDVIDEDFAAHWNAGNQLLSGTLYFKNNDRMKKLVEDWISRQRKAPVMWDQETLEEAVGDGEGMSIFKLPAQYCAVDHMNVPDPVIAHDCHNRIFKRITPNYDPFESYKKNMGKFQQFIRDKNVVVLGSGPSADEYEPTDRDEVLVAVNRAVKLDSWKQSAATKLWFIGYGMSQADDFNQYEACARPDALILTTTMRTNSLTPESWNSKRICSGAARVCLPCDWRGCSRKLGLKPWDYECNFSSGVQAVLYCLVGKAKSVRMFGIDLGIGGYSSSLPQKQSRQAEVHRSDERFLNDVTDLGLIGPSIPAPVEPATVEQPVLEWTGERQVAKSWINVEEKHRARYEWARDRVRGRRVLDCASGSGYGARKIAVDLPHVEVDAVDNSEEAIRFGEYYFKHERIRFWVGDVRDYKPTLKYDSIITLETLEHFQNPLEILETFRSMLSPGGRIILSIPTIKMPGNRWHLWDAISINDIVEMVSKGWNIIDIETQAGTHIMMEIAPKIKRALILGSAPYAPQILEMDIPEDVVILAMNNAWKIGRWGILMHPDNFHDLPKDIDETQRIVDGFEIIRDTCDRYFGLEHVGKTMFFCSAWWAVDTFRPEQVYVYGSDMHYPAGKTHFYGNGKPDPLKLGDKKLDACFENLGAFAARWGVEFINLSTGPSRLPYKRGIIK